MRNLRWWCVAFGAATALVSVGVIFKHLRKIESDIAFYPGETRLYSYSGDFLVDMRGALRGTNRSKESAQNTASISGSLAMKVFAVDKDGADVGFQFIDLSCSTPEKNSCAELYGAPFLTRIARDGEFRELTVSRGLSTRDERRIRGLLDSLQVVRRRNTSTWQNTERDVTGTALIRYSESSRHTIQREKLDYVKLSDSTGFVDNARIVASHFEVYLSPKKSWIDGINGSETIELSRQGETQMAATSTVHLAEREETTDSIAQHTWTTGTLTEFRALLQSYSTASKARLSPGALNTSESDRDVTSLALSLNGKLSPGEALIRCRSLTDFLTSHPDALKTLPALLRSGSLDEVARSRVLYALQNVGTNDAQAALVSIAQDPRQSPMTVRAAVATLGFLPINQATEEALWQIQATNGSHEDEVRSEMATFALGSAAGTLISNGDSRGDHVLETLTMQLDERARNNNYRDAEARLLSLGNSRAERVTPILQSYLSAEGDSVRRAAAVALGNIASVEARDALLDRLSEEESSVVRAAIVQSLSKHDLDETSFAVAAESFVEEPDRSVRISLARYLGRGSTLYPKTRRFLETLIALEQDPAVHKALVETPLPDTH